MKKLVVTLSLLISASLVSLAGASEVKVGSKAIKLKFNGKAYIGYEYYEPEEGDNWGQFTIRRNYFQVKAYFSEYNYFRTTLDVFANTSDDGKDKGSFEVRLKYAYLYLNNILPYTGVEIGIVHRPWHDWEEHHGWWYRSIEKIFFEEKHSAHLGNSADGGINFKTKIPNFSSEIGVFNGEGYHGADEFESEFFNNSLEARLTYHILGTGNKKVEPTKDSYFDISFNTLNSFNHKGGMENLNVYHGHFVYNNPRFLISGQYLTSNFDNGEREGDGFSGNFEFRPVEKIGLIGRYDEWDSENDSFDRNVIIPAVAYTLNKYVKFILSGKIVDYDNDDSKSFTVTKATAEVNW